MLCDRTFLSSAEFQLRLQSTLKWKKRPGIDANLEVEFSVAELDSSKSSTTSRLPYSAILRSSNHLRPNNPISTSTNYATRNMMPHEPTMARGIPESPSARALVMKGILQEQLGPINDFEFRGIWRLSRQRMLNHPRGPQAHGIPENNMIQAIWSHFCEYPSYHSFPRVGQLLGLATQTLCVANASTSFEHPNGIWANNLKVLKVRQGKGNIKGVPWVEINKRAGSTG